MSAPAAPSGSWPGPGLDHVRELGLLADVVGSPIYRAWVDLLQVRTPAEQTLNWWADWWLTWHQAAMRR